MPPPPLSVVIPTRDGASSIATAVDALVPQLRELGGELVVVDGTAEHRRTTEPLRWLPLRERSILGLRAHGVRSSAGEIIAIGEDHAVARPDWCKAILVAHAAHPEADAVVGCLANGTDATVSGRANFMAFASPWAPGMTSLPPRPPPISTVSIKRRALDGGSDAPGELEAGLLPRLHAEGRMVADSRIVADHFQDHGLRWAIVNAFAGTRASYGVARPRMTGEERRGHIRWVLLNLRRRLLSEARASGLAVDWRDLAAVVPIVVATGAGGAIGASLGPGRAAERVA